MNNKYLKPTTSKETELLPNLPDQYLEELTGKLVKHIRTLHDFNFVTVNSSVQLPAGSSYNFEAEEVNMTYQNMGATIIDSVLQAGVKYETVVKPRIMAYLSEYPDTKRTTDFFRLIKRIPIEDLINWKGEKCERIKLLTNFLTEKNIETEYDLRIWLLDKNNQVEIQKLRGIKDKTVDYLKMLSGNNSAIAVDRHLIKFLNNSGINITIEDYSLAREIISLTASNLQVNPSDLDHSIWHYMSTSK